MRNALFLIFISLCSVCKSSAQGGLVLDNFSSIAEQRYAQLKLAGELQKLKEISGDQLSDVEYQIKILEDQMEALDANLEYWKKQVDLATKGLEATLSVVDATENLKIALSKSLDDVVKALNSLLNTKLTFHLLKYLMKVLFLLNIKSVQ
jgi:septal ring factor EnvC (AmiA/AmiB activator)